jgi:hypothetical protein
MRGKISLAAALAATAIACVVVATAGARTDAGRAASAASSCQLGNGIQHVINLVFDNVHFARDNPNVPSDLEQMPHLLNYLTQYGTVFSNSHTPMIAHTADDSLTIYTGLYGDRHGQPLSNSYKVYNPDGSTDPATSFVYWTSPIMDTKNFGPPVPNPVDPAPSMVTTNGGIAPAPWVPFTRAGCTVGDFSTANMVLENAGDISTVFGASSPEAQETAANTGDSFRDIQVAKYIGAALHCPTGTSKCTSSSRPVDDLLPNEPGGYSNFKAVFGAKYIYPTIGGGTPNAMHNGYQVTDSNGNLVDLNGNTIQEPFSRTPGFPGFSPTATQTLAVLADMQENGVPVTYGYISDLHEKKSDTFRNCTTTGTTSSSGKPVGPGDNCYVQNAQHYDAAFNTFFQRLQSDGITPDNTLLVVSSEENDQFAGANATRVNQPTPAGCDGVTVPCAYGPGQIGELQANIKGLLAGTPSASTQFDIEPQGASLYVHGNPAANDPAVRQLERDTAAMTNPLDPYNGVANEKITKYQAGALEERVLHMQTADPLRFPTYSLFPKGDYFFSTSGAPVSINNGFAYDHGYYSPNIDVTWAAVAGPGVAVNGIDGPTPAQGNQAHDTEGNNTVPQASTKGTWVEETDIRPTMLHLLGLTDDYQSDGHVITQALLNVSPALAATEELAAGYDQVNSSVGQFATDTLIADSKALASGSGSDDSAYAAEQATLLQLADDRNQAVKQMKDALSAAAAGTTPSHGQIQSGLSHVKELLRRADQLAGS